MRIGEGVKRNVSHIRGNKIRSVSRLAIYCFLLRLDFNQTMSRPSFEMIESTKAKRQGSVGKYIIRCMLTRRGPGSALKGKLHRKNTFTTCRGQFNWRASRHGGVIRASIERRLCGSFSSTCRVARQTSNWASVSGKDTSVCFAAGFVFYGRFLALVSQPVTCCSTVNLFLPSDFWLQMLSVLF